MAEDLESNYARAGFNGRLEFGQSPALLVIDVVQAYLLKESPLYAGVEDALAANVQLISAARRAHVPVVYTKVAYGAGGADGGVFFRKVPALAAYLPGSPLAEFPPQIAPRDDEVVVIKQYASAFFGTSLASTLRTMGVDTVMIGGFSTSGCVRASALDALQNGFIPFVVREASGDRDARVQDANLFDLQAKYAEVVDLQAGLRLLGRADRSA